MADADREHWNARYREQRYEVAPAPWLAALAPRLAPAHPGARALDIAAGSGRHAFTLAERGYQVDAWDISDVGLQLLRDELHRRAVAGLPVGIAPRQVDLDHAVLPVEHFDLILDIQFLDRRLFDQIPRALRPGGLLLVHTFLYVPDGAITAGLSNPAHALQPGELAQTFGASLKILELTEDRATERAHLLARKPPR